MPVYILTAVMMIASDQLVKQWAVAVLKSGGSIPVIESVFHLTYVENRGAAFSLFSGMGFRWVFVVLAAAISVAVFVALKRGVIQTKLGRAALILVAAGALGNAIDRAVRGFVVDIFDFRLISFPVFNVADVLICAGGALFIFYVMFQYKDGSEEEES